MSSATPYLFNPARAEHDELDQTFVGRWPILHKLEKDLLDDAGGSTSRHWLLVGPRGTGKTHLTELLGRRLRREHGWEVVRLPEEQYQVASLADLLEQIIMGLGEPGAPSPFADEANSSVVEEKALEFLKTRGKAPGAKPLLVVLENLNRVLEKKLRSKREQTRFRQVLMRNAPFHVVATSPSYFDAVTQESAPFYDFFQTMAIEDLTREEVADLIEKRARYDRKEMLLANLEQVRARIEALYHLSGGNPRLVLALYSILKEGVSDKLHVQLLKLQDEVTPYYQARLEDISEQMARVLTQLALADGPRTSADIARGCRLPLSQTTANIAKLARDRFVKPGARPDKRSRYYEVTDRLFRLWIQMREDRGVRRQLPFLTEFFQQWYAGDLKEVRQATGRAADAFMKELSDESADRYGGPLQALDSVRNAVPDGKSDVALQSRNIAIGRSPAGSLPSTIAGLDELAGSAWLAEYCVSMATNIPLRENRVAWEGTLAVSKNLPPMLLQGAFIECMPIFARTGKASAGAVLEVYRRFREAGALSQDVEPYVAALRVRDAKDDGRMELDALHPEIREAVALLLHLDDPAAALSDGRDHETRSASVASKAAEVSP